MFCKMCISKMILFQWIRVIVSFLLPSHRHFGDLAKGQVSWEYTQFRFSGIYVYGLLVILCMFKFFLASQCKKASQNTPNAHCDDLLHADMRVRARVPSQYECVLWCLAQEAWASGRETRFEWMEPATSLWEILLPDFWQNCKHRILFSLALSTYEICSVIELVRKTHRVSFLMGSI